MKRFLIFFCFSFTTLFSALHLQRDVDAECAILINAKTGRVLWKKNADKRAFPASTTKIATTFYALMKKGDALDQLVQADKEALFTVLPSKKREDNYRKCPSYWLETDGTKAGLKRGSSYSIEELLYATMLVSGNDSANVLATGVSGSIDSFVDELNSFMQELGLKESHFCNPHGLHHPEHVTTARDLARLTQFALYHPIFKEIASSTSYEPKRAKADKYMRKNRFLQKGPLYCPGAFGVKTGYHSNAQCALVAAAEREDRSLICVLLHCKDRDSRFRDAKYLFDSAFKEKLLKKTFIPAGEQSFHRDYTGGVGVVKTYTKEPLLYHYYPSEEPIFRSTLSWEKLDPTITKDSAVGTIYLFADDVEVGSVVLYAKNEVKETFFFALKKKFLKAGDYLLDHWILTILLLCVFLLLLRFFYKFT